MDFDATRSLSIAILGASYGMLFAIKALSAGHRVLLVGRPEEVGVIRGDGICVEFPAPNGGELFEVGSSALPGELRAATPEGVDVAEHDLVVLAMQEPQFAAPSVQALLERIGRSGRPCLSLMNMPPMPYLKRIPALAPINVEACYASAGSWSALAPDQMTLCSPDPQAFRPPGMGLNSLRVGLATNFRAAPFTEASDTRLLRRLATSVNDARVSREGRRSALPVRLRVSDSLFVPLSKWSMLLAGNYRCVEDNGIRSIRSAVLDDAGRSRKVYDFVNSILRALGAEDSDLVNFDHYASAARHLVHPSSAARALTGGATAIERVDRLVQAVARHLSLDSSPIDQIVDQIDRRLVVNRRAA